MTHTPEHVSIRHTPAISSKCCPTCPTTIYTYPAPPGHHRHPRPQHDLSWQEPCISAGPRIAPLELVRDPLAYTWFTRRAKLSQTIGTWHLWVWGKWHAPPFSVRAIGWPSPSPHLPIGGGTRSVLGLGLGCSPPPPRHQAPNRTPSHGASEGGIKTLAGRLGARVIVHQILQFFSHVTQNSATNNGNSATNNGKSAKEHKGWAQPISTTFWGGRKLAQPCSTTFLVEIGWPNQFPPLFW